MIPLFKPGCMAFNAIAANSVMFPDVISHGLVAKLMKMCENHSHFLYDTNTMWIKELVSDFPELFKSSVSQY